MSGTDGWCFRRMQRGKINADPVQGEFFTQEGFDDSLVREVIQNSLDAAASTRTSLVAYWRPHSDGRSLQVPPHRVPRDPQRPRTSRADAPSTSTQCFTTATSSSCSIPLGHPARLGGQGFRVEVWISSDRRGPFALVDGLAREIYRGAGAFSRGSRRWRGGAG